MDAISLQTELVSQYFNRKLRRRNQKNSEKSQFNSYSTAVKTQWARDLPEYAFHSNFPSCKASLCVKLTDQEQSQPRSQVLWNEVKSAFIDHITTESGRAARIESHGAYYIQATHLQQISDLSILNDKSKLSISNKVKRYKLSINNIKLI